MPQSLLPLPVSSFKSSCILLLIVAIILVHDVQAASIPLPATTADQADGAPIVNRTIAPKARSPTETKWLDEDEEDAKFVSILEAYEDESTTTASSVSSASGPRSILKGPLSLQNPNRVRFVTTKTKVNLQLKHNPRKPVSLKLDLLPETDVKFIEFDDAASHELDTPNAIDTIGRGIFEKVRRRQEAAFNLVATRWAQDKTRPGYERELRRMYMRGTAYLVLEDRLAKPVSETVYNLTAKALDLFNLDNTAHWARYQDISRIVQPLHVLNDMLKTYFAKTEFSAFRTILGTEMGMEGLWNQEMHKGLLDLDSASFAMGKVPVAIARQYFYQDAQNVTETILKGKSKKLRASGMELFQGASKVTQDTLKLFEREIRQVLAKELIHRGETILNETLQDTTQEILDLTHSYIPHDLASQIAKNVSEQTDAMKLAANFSVYASEPQRFYADLPGIFRELQRHSVRHVLSFFESSKRKTREERLTEIINKASRVFQFEKDLFELDMMLNVTRKLAQESTIEGRQRTKLLEGGVEKLFNAIDMLGLKYGLSLILHVTNFDMERHYWIKTDPSAVKVAVLNLRISHAAAFASHYFAGLLTDTAVRAVI